MSLTTYGTTEAGGGLETALAGTTAMDLIGPMTTKDRQSLRVFVAVCSDVVIRLNYQFSPDGGTTWLIGKQVAATTVTEDGGTSGYVKSCQLDMAVGYIWRVQVYNTTGGNGKIAYEHRIYAESG